MPTAVVLNLPEHGHMNATYPVVAELVRRGERIIYYATEPYRSRVEETGAEFVSYGDDASFRPPAHQGGLYSVMAYLMGLTENVLPSLLDKLRSDPPDYLLIDSMCVWGRLAQQLLKLPAVTLGSVFVPNDQLVSMEDMVAKAYGQAPKEVLLAGIDALNTYLEISQRVDSQYGTESPNIVEFFANRQPLNISFTSRYFHLLGEHFDDSYKFVGPSMAPRVEDSDDLDLKALGNGPLVYISMGTIFNGMPGFYRNCIEALGGSEYRVVMPIGSNVDRNELGDIPRNFAVRESVPQLKVLEQAALFLTHGGMNSTSEALWHEVPLLVYPQHGDQHLVAARVAELGAGLRLHPPDVEPARLRELVDQVANDAACRHNARRIANSFKTAGGYRRAAEEILTFTRGLIESTAEQEKRYVDSLHAGASSTRAHQPHPAGGGRVGAAR